MADEPPEIVQIRRQERESLRERWLAEAGARVPYRGQITEIPDGIWRSVSLTWESLQARPEALRVNQEEFVPVGISASALITDRERLRLAFMAYVLARQTGKVVDRGEVVIEKGGALRAARVDLEGALRKIGPLLRKVTALLASDDPGSHFRLNRHCGECGFSRHCRKKAVELDHLSLLTSLSSRHNHALIFRKHQSAQ